jgi:hypothetical protein
VKRRKSSGAYVNRYPGQRVASGRDSSHHVDDEVEMGLRVHAPGVVRLLTPTLSPNGREGEYSRDIKRTDSTLSLKRRGGVRVGDRFTGRPNLRLSPMTRRTGRRVRLDRPTELSGVDASSL